VPDYGPLSGLVGTVGAIGAAGAAILLTWRGRARFEPSESDVPKAPERIAGVVTTVLIAVLWAGRSGLGTPLLSALAIGLAVLAVAALLGYVALTGSQTYEDTRHHRKIIGGFSLLPGARAEIRKRRLTTQQYFAVVEFDPDRVWPRGRRALAKTGFTAVYLVLIVSGSIALTSAALLVEGQAAPSPSATPTVSARALRWVDAAAGGAVLDGGVLQPGKKVWLEELFPGQPPTGFQVVEAVDERWPLSVQAAIAALRQPTFAPTVAGYRAVSDAAWSLPAPLGGAPSRTFTFTDTNPGVPSVSGSIIVGEAAFAANPVAGCSAPDAAGGYAGGVGSACLGITVSVAQDPTFDAEVLVPWGQGSQSLTDAVAGYFGSLDQLVASDAPGVAFDPATALEEFRAANARLLPEAAPKGWAFSVDPASFDAVPGRPAGVRLVISAPSPGATLVAIRLRNRSTGATVLSQLFPVEVAGNASPTVEIFEPKIDMVGIDRLSYTGFENGEWFTDVVLSALGEDQEDGSLTGASVVWTTDRADLQAPLLGDGEQLRARLYSGSCEGGATHVVTVTVTDSAGATATATRTIELGQVC
jgi:hypothetical protein